MRGRKIIDYTHAIGRTLNELPIAVRNMMDQGWQPYGYPIRGDDTWWEQPMVKYHEDEGTI